MAVTVIPFQMPEPMEIPAHIVEHLRQLPTDEAVRKGMELLLQIEAADVLVWERLDAEGRLQLGDVQTRQGSADGWRQALEGQAFYGEPVSDEGSGLAGRALASGSALLVLGQAEATGSPELPAALTRALIGGDGGGNVGFLYVLPLRAEDGTTRGVLTLIRGAGEGPLNHDQPNITEAMRRLLSSLPPA